MQMDDRFSTSDDVVSRDVSGEMVLLNLDSGTYFGLNEVGARIWQMLESGPVSISALRDQLLDEYEVDQAEVESSVIEIMQKLVDNQLVVPA